MMQPHRIMAELDEHRTRKFFTLVTSFMAPLFDTAIVDVALLMVCRSCAFSTIAATTMTFLIGQVINTSPALRPQGAARLLSLIEFNHPNLSLLHKLFRVLKTVQYLSYFNVVSIWNRQ